MTSTIRAVDKMTNSLTVDNRDSLEMIQYMEARIEALKARIRELEKEKREREEVLA